MKYLLVAEKYVKRWRTLTLDDQDLWHIEAAIEHALEDGVFDAEAKPYVVKLFNDLEHMRTGAPL